MLGDIIRPVTLVFLSQKVGYSKGWVYVYLFGHVFPGRRAKQERKEPTQAHVTEFTVMEACAQPPLPFPARWRFLMKCISGSPAQGRGVEGRSRSRDSVSP